MKQIHVAAAIIQQEDTIFVAQRKNSGELALKWEFPGGKLEEGESGEEAIVREIKEELSVDISVKRHFMRVSHQYEKFFLTMDAYLCTLENGTIYLSEHVDSRWINGENMMELDWAAADIPIAKKLQSELKAYEK
jgi:8-oxo-dGTP diphosphatase